MYKVTFIIIFVSLYLVSCYDNKSNNNNYNDFDIKKQIFYDPPEVLGIIPSIYERKKGFSKNLNHIKINDNQNLYFIYGANITRLSFAVYLNDTNKQLINNLKEINDTLNIYLESLEVNNTLNDDKRYEDYFNFSYGAKGFDKIYKSLENGKPDLILDDKYASILIGSWIEFIWITKSHLENGIIDTTNFIETRLSLENVKHHLKVHFNSKLSNELKIEIENLTEQYYKIINVEYEDKSLFASKSLKSNKIQNYNSIQLKKTFSKIDELKLKYIGY